MKTTEVRQDMKMKSATSILTRSILLLLLLLAGGVVSGAWVVSNNCSFYVINKGGNRQINKL